MTGIESMPTICKRLLLTCVQCALALQNQHTTMGVVPNHTTPSCGHAQHNAKGLCIAVYESCIAPIQLRYARSEEAAGLLLEVSTLVARALTQPVD